MTELVNELNTLNNTLPTRDFLNATHTPHGIYLLRAWNSYNTIPRGYMYYVSGIEFLKYAHSLSNGNLMYIENKQNIDASA